MITIHKNRNRERFTFANINLLGNCNADCYFCLGKDIANELKGKNQLNTHYTAWLNFVPFLQQCRENGVTKLYLTGQTADGLQYRFIDELNEYLLNRGFTLGIRTNGYLAEYKISSIQKLQGGVGFSIHSLTPSINKAIMGKDFLPNWCNIIPKSGKNVRISIVLNRYNISEINNLIKFASCFENVRYIQVRRISTDTRINLLQEDIDLYEQYYIEFSKNNQKIGEFCLAEKYILYGKEVNFWRTVETSCNSLNYFTDGTSSSEYFIVEGYLKNKITDVKQ